MKVLWVINTPIYIDEEHASSTRGGWMEGALRQAVKVLDMHVAFPVTTISVKGEKIGNIYYHYFQYNQFSKGKVVYNDVLEDNLCHVIDSSKPDIIHIWGTEYLHSIAAVNAAEKLGVLSKTIINLQGLVSVYAGHYKAGIPYQYCHKRTLIELLRGGSLKAGKRNLEQRGMFEKEAIGKIKNVIGRTDWDRACAQQINPKVHYYFCNEIIRDNLYLSEKWNLQKCRKHSLFITQPGNPIKGFHNVLIALGIIKRKYQDVILYVTGKNFLNKDTVEGLVDKILFNFPMKYRYTSYERYLSELIQEFCLDDCIYFTGELSKEQMQEYFLKTNIFVSSSSVENESNAISEAHMLGVPVVASYVGGVTNRIEHGYDGYLYPYNEPYMLAYYIDKLFQNPAIEQKFSLNGIASANTINNVETNRLKLLQIYQDVLGESV